MNQTNNKVKFGIEYENCLQLKGDVRDLVKELYITNALIIPYVYSKETANTYKSGKIKDFCLEIGITSGFVTFTNGAFFSPFLNTDGIQVYLGSDADEIREIQQFSPQVRTYNCRDNVKTVKTKKLTIDRANLLSEDEFYIPYVDKVYKKIMELIEQ